MTDQSDSSSGSGPTPNPAGNPSRIEIDLVGNGVAKESTVIAGNARLETKLDELLARKTITPVQQSVPLQAAPVNTSQERQMTNVVFTAAAPPRRHSIPSLLGIMTSAIYAIALAVFVIFADAIGSSMMSQISQWWGLVGGIYIVCQIAEVVRRKPFEEASEMLDLVSSPLAAAVEFILIPGLFIMRSWYTQWEWPHFWAWHIWITALPFAIADLMLLTVLYKISRSVSRVTSPT
jgi:hypothetical protein